MSRSSATYLQTAFGTVPVVRTLAIVFTCLISILFDLSCSIAAEDVDRNAVVKVHKTQDYPDFYRPWRIKQTVERAASGVIIKSPNGGEERFILTNAHVVRYATQIYIQPHQSTEKFAATVVTSAPGIDLALLKLDDPNNLSDYAPLSLADELPHIKDTVNAYGFPVGGDQLSVTEGIVSRIEVGHYYFETIGIRIQIDAALNSGNSGGPAVANKLLVGLVFSGLRSADRIGYLIPAEEIRRFLIDIEDGEYLGKPSLFDQFQTAENEAIRQRLGLDKEVTGVVVTKPYGESESYPLKRWDVITHIGDSPIDKTGRVEIRDDLRLRFDGLVPRFVERGEVPISVRRSNKKITLRVPVEYERDRVIPMVKYDYPEYAILGPLVFSVPSQEMVQKIGEQENGFVALNRLMNPLLYRLGDERAFPGEQLVFLSCRMFSHRMTKGYQSPWKGVLTHLNDEPVKNLAHLVELYRDSSAEFMEFTFAGLEETLVFRRTKLLEATDKILEKEGIRHQFSPRLRKIWNTGEKD